MTRPYQNPITLKEDALEARFPRLHRRFARRLSEYIEACLHQFIEEFYNDDSFRRMYEMAWAEYLCTINEPIGVPDPSEKIRQVLSCLYDREMQNFHWEVSFQRTLRVPDNGEEYPLPAGMGRFPLRLLQTGTDSQLSLPMYSWEAMWMMFSSAFPCMVEISSGGVNVLTGKKINSRNLGPLGVEGQDYFVTPVQPWLDGFCTGLGDIRQFVAKPLVSGETVEEQLADSAKGSLQFRIHPLKAEKYFDLEIRPKLPHALHELRNKLLPLPRVLGDQDFICKRISGLPSQNDAENVGLAAGGSLSQQIYRDPYPPTSWEDDYVEFSLHLCEASHWKSLTGELPPAQTHFS